jgi:hypothetical protein
MLSGTRRDSVFFSFHYDKDVFRMHMVKNMGVIEGEEPISVPDWETLRRKGDAAVENWIDDHMKYKQAVVVLIGEETASRPWVQYEIKKAWNEKRPLVGIYVHNLKSMGLGVSRKGPNPFSHFTFTNGTGNMGQYIPCYDPNSLYAYNDIKSNIASWVKSAAVRN